MRPIGPEMSDQARWNQRYADEQDQSFSWTETASADSVSLQWILDATNRDARIADVGAGRSMLIDHLLARGYRHLAHVEWSDAASRDVQNRLGQEADAVEWFAGDVCEWVPGRPIDLWHDRAVFHFQTIEAEKQRYLQTLDRIVSTDGSVLLATFHLDGPETCSGFPVARYDATGLMTTLATFTDSTWCLERECVHAHHTPGGRVQLFQYVLARKISCGY